MRSYIVRGVMLLTVAVLATGGSSAQAVTADTEQVFRCHIRARAPYLCDYTGGCDRDLKLARERLDGAYRCMRELLRCDLLTRLELPGGERCMERAARRCAAAQSRQEDFIAILGANQREELLSKCGAVDLQTEFLGAWIGLGYGLDAATCDGMFGMSLADPADYIECGDRYVTRLHAQLLSLVAPRSQQLIEDNGWCRLFPEEGVTPVICNTGLVLSPSVTQSVPEATVGDLRRCQHQLSSRIVRMVLEAHLDLLENCAEEYLNCNLKQARGEFLDGAYDSCMSDARATCERFKGYRDRRISYAIPAMINACGQIGLEDLSDVLGFVDVASSCGASSVGDLIACIVARVPCLAWDIVSFVEPRMLIDVPPELWSQLLTGYESCGQ